MAMISERYRPEHRASPGQRILRIALLAIIVSSIVRLFLFETYSIDGAAMLPGAARGELVLACRFSHGLRLPFFNNAKIFSLSSPETGDLVFVRHPWGSQSGFAEFFDIATLSLFGISDAQEIRLIRVLAGGGDRIRVAADGIVHVNDKPLPQKHGGQVVLRARKDAAGNWQRQQIVGRELVAADRLPEQASVQPDLVFSVFDEGDWKIARTTATASPVTPVVFPLPVTNAALAATLAERFVARTLLRGDLSAGPILVQDHERRDAAPGRVVVSHDREGSLWYAVPGEVERQLIRVDGGVATLIVPEGMIFTLNDLRDYTEDSRLWGPIPEKYIVGAPFLRVWPLSRTGSLD